MNIKKLIIPLLIIISSTVVITGLLPFVSLNSSAQEIQNNLKEDLQNSLKKNGFVEVISRIAKDDYKSSLERLSEYAQKNKSILSKYFIPNQDRVESDTKLPSIYENEIKRTQSRLEKHPEILKNTTFNEFSPYATTYIKDPENLKKLLEIIEPKMENKPNSTQLNNSTSSIGANNSWLRDGTNVSSPDIGPNGEGANKIIAILDTGVQKNHPFLNGKVNIEGCFSYTSPGSVASLCPNGSNTQYGSGAGAPCTGYSACSHGTHVAGIAAGLNGSYEGKTLNGVARKADIASLQVFSKVTSAAICSSIGLSAPCILTYPSAQIDALNYVGLGVIIHAIFNTPKRFASANMSLGGGNNTSNCDSDSRKAPIDMLKSMRVATVIAAGNSGQYGVATPACISSAIAVSSTDSSVATPVLASTSQAHSSLTDISAPGASILSSIPTNNYGTKGGTSMAAPHIAGAMAILHGVFPSHSVDNNLKLLKDIAKPFTYSKNSNSYSSKRLVLCRDYYYYFGSWKCSRLIWWPFDIKIYDVFKE